MKYFSFFIALVIVLSFFSGFSNELETELTAGSNKIKRYGHVIGLKKEFEERYIILHKHTFPGVLDRISKSNIRNYSIFLKDGILFSFFEYIGQDFKSDMTLMADEVTKEWWKLTDPMQEPLKTRKEGERWASLEILYEMNSSKKPYQKAARSAYMAPIKPDQKQNFKDRLNQMDEVMLKLYLEHHVQNLTFYFHDDQVYFYSEYVGNDYTNDMTLLFQNEAMSKLDSDLIALLQPAAGTDQGRAWQQMKEVFHTH